MTLTFILNFIPTIGSIIATFITLAMVLAQTGDPATTLAVGSDEIAAISAGLVGARGSLPAPEAVPVLDAAALPPDEA